MNILDIYICSFVKVFAVSRVSRIWRLICAIILWYWKECEIISFFNILSYFAASSASLDVLLLIRNLKNSLIQIFLLLRLFHWYYWFVVIRFVFLTGNVVINGEKSFLKPSLWVFYKCVVKIIRCYIQCIILIN